jgi:hypothetical protein
MDGEFAPLRGDLADLGVGLNTTAYDEHVGEIECYILVIKERMQANSNTLPFKHAPAWLVIEMANAAVFLTNAFLSEHGISKTFEPLDDCDRARH